MKGWESDFAFYLLQIMALFSILNYLGLLVCNIHSIALFQSSFLIRITGSNYQGSFLAYVATNVCLTAHRLFYTLLPLQARFILKKSILKACILSMIAFYIAYVCFTLTPLASVVYCPAQIFFYFERRRFLGFIQVMNQVSNFVVGVVNVSAYTVMFGTLFLKGTLTFTHNNEIRMTLQAAVVSFFELLFFLYWEYGPSSGLSEFWQRVCDGYSILLYFDVLILPYMISNKSVKSELNKIFSRKRRDSTAKTWSHPRMPL
ncbi:unnamed protein product [Cylicocyclus nassatus]|uniref:Uncharacterized protein n=1 Tax=Cylicocyclus nassatus TaxID=53992 RepID=A0AA36M601_CYLNA|nr:unnamed protein product [Cylicocyclus nassatus]